MASDMYSVLAVLALSLLILGALAQLVALVSRSHAAQQIATSLLLPATVVCLVAVIWAGTLLLTGNSPAMDSKELQVSFMAAAGLVALVTLSVRARERRDLPGLAPARSFLYVFSGMLAVGASLYLMAGANPLHPVASEHQNMSTAAPAAGFGAGTLLETAATCSVADAIDIQPCDLDKDNRHAPGDLLILTGGVDNPGDRSMGSRWPAQKQARSGKARGR